MGHDPEREKEPRSGFNFVSRPGPSEALAGSGWSRVIMDINKPGTDGRQQAIREYYWRGVFNG